MRFAFIESMTFVILVLSSSWTCILLNVLLKMCTEVDANSKQKSQSHHHQYLKEKCH